MAHKLLLLQSSCHWQQLQSPVILHPSVASSVCSLWALFNITVYLKHESMQPFPAISSERTIFPEPGVILFYTCRVQDMNQNKNSSIQGTRPQSKSRRSSHLCRAPSLLWAPAQRGQKGASQRKSCPRSSARCFGCSICQIAISVSFLSLPDVSSESSL